MSPTTNEPVMIAVPSSDPRMTSAVSRGRRVALRNASRRRIGLRTSTKRNGSDRTATRIIDRRRATARRRRRASSTSSSLTIRPSRIVIARFALRTDALVVRHDDQREPVGVQLAQELHHLFRRLRVERARGLVGPHDAGAAGQRAGDGDALLLAARQLGGPVLQARAETDAFERLRRAAARFLCVDAGEQQRQLGVLDRAEHRDEVVRLEDEAHRRRAVRGAPRVGERVKVDAVEQHPTAVDVVEARAAVEQRRLARARTDP